MADNAKKLSPRQAKALNALLCHGTVLGAATASGIGARTIARYLKDEIFQASYDDAQKQQMAMTVASIQAHCNEATQTLGEIMRDSNQPPQARVASARTILEHGLGRTDAKSSAAEIEDRLRQEHRGEVARAAEEFNKKILAMAHRKRLVAQ